MIKLTDKKYDSDLRSESEKKVCSLSIQKVTEMNLNRN